MIIGAEYVLKMLPKGTHDYDKFIKPAELLHWCDEAQLTCLDMVGYHYNPLTGKFWLNKDVSANYMASFSDSVLRCFLALSQTRCVTQKAKYYKILRFLLSTYL
ncbi:3-demethylubiquinone-9 3-methyltransferase [Pasteurella multocida]|nr:3-demethylubiquinone-9 3-methyltransferase [Pasteurella multocida]